MVYIILSYYINIILYNNTKIMRSFYLVLRKLSQLVKGKAGPLLSLNAMTGDPEAIEYSPTDPKS
jgi:hypothetical protein